MLDRFLHNWWRWVGQVLFAVGLWYGYEGLEVDSRHADALEQVDKRGLEIDREIQDVEKELQDANSLTQRVRVSAKLVKLEKEKSRFLNDSMKKSVAFYLERQSTIMSFLYFFVAAILVWAVVPTLQTRWLRWRNRHRFHAATREKEVLDDVIGDN